MREKALAFWFPDVWQGGANLFLFLSASAILIGVAVSFLEAESSGRKRRCPVSTATMIAFFFFSAGFLVSRRGAAPLPPPDKPLFFLSGLLLAAWGAVENIRARIQLGRFWSDHIVIRDAHQAVTSGLYARARHPMYGTLVLYGLGLCLLYANLAGAALVAGVFLPMVLWRARAEETELSGVKGYPEYAKSVPMLLPRFSPLGDKVFRSLGLLAFAWALFACRMSLPSLLLLTLFHFLSAFMLFEAKVRFAYGNRVLLLPALFAGSWFVPPLAYGFHLLLALALYGMFFNCPCMAVYEKYGRCPCWDALGKVFKCSCARS